MSTSKTNRENLTPEELEELRQQELDVRDIKKIKAFLKKHPPGPDDILYNDEALDFIDKAMSGKV